MEPVVFGRWRIRIRVLFWSAVAAALVGAWAFLTQPVLARRTGTSPEVDPKRLEADVRSLSETFFPRDSEHTGNLDRAAQYILGELKTAGGETRIETFTVRGKAYHNVVAEFGPESEQRVVMGAHYDACGEFPGADDNASGVAGLLALARLLGRSTPPARVELVAFTLEERSRPISGAPSWGARCALKRLRERA